MTTVEEFIARRWSKDANWLDGNCYWFARILSLRFPELEVWYCPIEGHFVAGNRNGHFYDWTGRIAAVPSMVRLSDLQTTDPIQYARLVRDCID